MPHPIYVYPNTCELAQRGGLIERWKLAQSLDCSFVEVPGDFIKNSSEEKRTGLTIGDFLDFNAIQVLYNQNSKIPEELKYILHTEPSLPREDRYGLLHHPPLKWHDKIWNKRFVEMITRISRFLGKPASAIEIHPGDKRNNCENIVSFIKLLLKVYNDEFGVEPLILIENRTRQFISNGADVALLWNFLADEFPELCKKVGIVLDVQQLYTSTKKSFLNQFDLIPSDSLRGLHIHSKHSVPKFLDPIPWRYVFKKLQLIEDELIINPEVSHKKT